MTRVWHSEPIRIAENIRVAVCSRAEPSVVRVIRQHICLCQNKTQQPCQSHSKNNRKQFEDLESTERQSGQYLGEESDGDNSEGCYWPASTGVIGSSSEQRQTYKSNSRSYSEGSNEAKKEPDSSTESENDLEHRRDHDGPLDLHDSIFPFR